MISRRHAFLSVMVAAIAANLGCPSSEEDPIVDPVKQTRIVGRAPLNAGGRVKVVSHDSSLPSKEEDIDDSGHFQIDIKAGDGRFTLVAAGGHYTEPANGSVVQHPGESLHAALLDAHLYETNEVAITPWTEIAYAHGIEGYADALKAFTDTLTCQGKSYTKTLQVPPALPTEGINSLTSPAALAYFYMGAFSRLADDLSDLYGVQAGGARLNSMRLAKVLAEDFADGFIDGKNKNGDPVFLVADNPLPPDVLRQQLAQSLRRFLKTYKPEGDTKSWGNESPLGETAMRDFLHCICDSKDTLLGPVVEETLDLEGPTLAIVTPQAGAYLASAQDVICEAKDSSGIASLDVTFVRDKAIQVEARGTPQLFGENKKAQRLVAPLRFDNVTTGELEVRCEAVDRWGNKSTIGQTLYVNRGGVGPELKVKAEDAKGLKGFVDITCDCRADQYSSQCDLVAPKDAPGLQVSEQTSRLVTYTWDTTKVLDGQKTLTCGNTTRGVAQPLTHSKSVYVKNHADGLARGAVFLDTVVKGMEVQAFAYDNGEQGELLGGGDVDSDGRFEFPLSTEHRGPIVLRATYSQTPTQIAEFHNVPLGKMMSCTNATLTLLIDYEPGQHLKALSINVASSMHEVFATALFKLGRYPTFQQAANHAQALVTHYLSGSGASIDPRKTPVMDLSKRVERAADDQMVMGLFHVGLSRLGVDYSLRYGRGSDQAITISEILQAMRDDLVDGKLDGKAHGAQVYMPHNAPLSEDFFRIELARAIRRWLDETPLVNGQRVTSNASGLTKDVVTAQSPILQNFANHHSPLFDNRPGQNYDGDGPSIDWHAFGPDQQEFALQDATLGSTSFRLVVDAKDESGIAQLKVTHNGVLLASGGHSSDVGHGEYVINTSTLKDTQRIVIEAQDDEGNPATVESIVFTVDRVVPTVTLDANERWVRDGTSYRLVGTVAKPHVTAQVFLDDEPTRQAARLDSTAFSVPVELECGQMHRVRIEVRDDAGNTDQKHQIVYCDNKAPALSQLASPFTQEKDGHSVELTFRVHPDPNNITLTKSRDEVTALQKQWNRMDDREEHDPPTLNFSVGDLGSTGIGTLNEALSVSYKYIFRGAGVTRERDWTPITCTREGVCKVVMSYQTMLPLDVLRQPVAVARKQNFVAYSSADDLHSILIRAVDLAGNVAVAEWTARLKLFSPPITATCSFAPELVAAGLMGGAGQFADVAAGKAPVFNMKLSTLFTTDASSYTPTDDSLTVSVPDVSLDWRIDHVITQEQRGGAARPGEYERPPSSCSGGDQSYFRYFRDKDECRRGRPDDRTLNGWTRAPDMTDLVGSQKARPQAPTVQLQRSRDSVDMPFFGDTSIFSNRAYHLEAGGSAFNTPELVYSRLEGIGYYGAVGRYSNDGVWKIEEKKFVKDLRIIRAEANPRHVGSSAATPEPIRIDMDSCAQKVTASWRDNSPASLMQGNPPDINDTWSGYGAPR